MASQHKWKVGEQEFEALMRMLDNLVRAHWWHCPYSLCKLSGIGLAPVKQMIFLVSL